MALTITVREAKAALVQLKKLTPARPRLDDDTKLSFKEAVFLMAPELVAMTKRGFTLKELAAGLQAQSIPVKPATLNRYLNEYKTGLEEGEPTAKSTQVETKEADSDDVTGTAQESAVAGEANVAENEAENKAEDDAEKKAENEAENKAEVITQAERAGSPSEKAAEKAKTPRSDYWRPFNKSQEQNPLRPAEERTSGFRI